MGLALEYFRHRCEIGDGRIVVVDAVVVVEVEEASGRRVE